MIRSWMNPIGHRRLTLVLSLLVLFTLLHTALVTTLRNQVDSRLSRADALPHGLPTLKMPAEKNAAPLYRAAWELQQKAQTSSPVGLAATKLYVHGEVARRCRENPAQVRLLLDTYRVSLQLLEQAHQQPFCDYQLHYEQAYSMMLPNFISIRSLGFLVAVATEEAKSRQDWSQACHFLTQGLKYARTLEPNQSPISLMIRVAVAQIVLDASEGIPPQQVGLELRQEALACSQTLLQDWDRSLQGEKANVTDCYRKLCDGKMNLNEFFNNINGHNCSGWAQSFEYYAFAVGGTPLILWDELTYLDWLERVQKDPVNTKPDTFVLASAFTYDTARAYEHVQKTRQSLAALAAR